MTRSWRPLLRARARRADGAGVGASEPPLGSGCQCAEQTGMASMSLLIAAHQKVDTAVSSSLPGALVRGASAAVCSRVCLTGMRSYLYSLGRRVEADTSVVSRVVLSPTISANLNVTQTAEETSGGRGREGDLSRPPCKPGGHRACPLGGPQGGPGEGSWEPGSGHLRGRNGPQLLGMDLLFNACRKSEK